MLLWLALFSLRFRFVDAFSITSESCELRLFAFEPPFFRFRVLELMATSLESDGTVLISCYNVLIVVCATRGRGRRGRDWEPVRGAPAVALM